MNSSTKTTELQDVVRLAHSWHPKDVKWLIAQLQRLVDEPPVQEKRMVDEVATDFDQAAHYVLQKNQELYKRLS